MRCRLRIEWVAYSLILALPAGAAEPPLAEYFRSETTKLAARPLAAIESAEAWKAQRAELQRQFYEMLGLWPIPAKTALHARVTGIVEHPEFVIEMLLYESRPGLYVTGNLYRPKVVERPLPAVLYVCGHAAVEKEGTIYGCKAHYQHHAAWYAANGYVCLVVDTLELGELPGLHHGTCHLGMWWWYSRGFTPAGVEAWNAIRAIDYLVSRPEVDASRIGVTGRSGGGATSWWVGALDDRVRAVVPVAGITDLQNHVVDGIVQGHCDCMYHVNTYRWDFPLVAALTAPKSLLVENTNHDPIFPEDGVRRIYTQLEKVYAWYGASDRLGLVIGEGGHVDSTEVRHPSFAFMEKWLKGRVESTVVEPERKIPIEQLKVLGPGEIPPGNRNDRIHETFVAAAPLVPVSQSSSDFQTLRTQRVEAVRTKVFGGWPGEQDTVSQDPKVSGAVVHEGIRYRALDYTTQPGVRLRLWLLTQTSGSDGASPLKKLNVWVADESFWQRWSWLPDPKTRKLPSRDDWRVTQFRDSTLLARVHQGEALAIVSPRGVGSTAWDPKLDTHIRRRFALLGQTLGGMQIWDVRRALAALATVKDFEQSPVRLGGERQAAHLAFWATVFEPKVEKVTLCEPPATVRDGPELLNLDHLMTFPEALALVFPREVALEATDAAVWTWAAELGRRLAAERPCGENSGNWPRFVP